MSVHGTNSGYSAHYQTWRTPPCPACKEAHRKSLADWRRQQARKPRVGGRWQPQNDLTPVPAYCRGCGNRGTANPKLGQRSVDSCHECRNVYV